MSIPNGDDPNRPTDRLEALPPAAKFVCATVVVSDETLTAAQIADRTLLPQSTVYGALAQLRGAALVEPASTSTNGTKTHSYRCLPDTPPVCTSRMD